MADTPQQPQIDTDQQALGSVYAKALLAAAEKAGDIDLVMEEMASLMDDVFAKMPQFYETLTSFRISHEQKVEMLDKAFGGKMCATLLNFLKVVSQHHRMNCLPAIRQQLRQQYNELKGRLEVILTSVEPIDEGLAARISARLKEAFNAEIDLRTEIDPEILGGVVIRIGDTVYDGSVLNQLNNLHAEVLEQSTRRVQQTADQLTIAESA